MKLANLKHHLVGKVWKQFHQVKVSMHAPLPPLSSRANGDHNTWMLFVSAKKKSIHVSWSSGLTPELVQPQACNVVNINQHLKPLI